VTRGSPLGFFAMVALLAACGARPSQMPHAEHWDRYIEPTGRDGRSFQLRSTVCEGMDLRPDYSTLNEASLVRFLEQQQLSVQIQHQQVDPKQPPLTFLFVGVPDTAQPVPLRVAILPNSDESARALYDALLQRGPGVWGFHRSNLSILGPPGTRAEDIEFAAKTKLACWGTLTLAEGDEVTAVPGGYTEP
jgi:hypothetical protein